MKDRVNPNAILADHYELAYHAHRNTSFSPDRRAKDCVESHSEELEEDLKIIEAHGGDTERYKAMYIRKFSAWLGAKSRCLSSMITGPSNFPVRRAQKANDAEHNRSIEFMEWRKKVLNRITKPENTDIVKGSDGAIEKMEAKLEKLEDMQSLMKEANKIIRDKHDSKDMRLMELGLSAKSAYNLLEVKDRGMGQGFPGYSLTNNGAKIRNLKKDIESERNRLDKYTSGNKEYSIGDIQVIENAEDNRLQLFFDGKPDPEVRTELKKRGFRWSPKNSCWQRQLTENAIYSLKRLSFIQSK